IGVDLDDVEMAALHSEWCLRLYTDLDDPWGILEGKLLTAQLALLEHRLDDAATILDECASLQVEEPEPRQHHLLTRAWLACERGQLQEAHDLIEQAMRAFPESRRVGDHAPQLLARLSRYPWPSALRPLIATWRAELKRPTRAAVSPTT